MPRFRLPRFRFIGGLAFRYSLFFLLAFSLILFIPIAVGILLSGVMLYVNSQRDAKILTERTISQFQNVIQPAELVPRTLVQAMENNSSGHQEILRIAQDFVRHDTVVFGTCLAFAPDALGKGQYWDAYYSCEVKGALVTRKLGGPDYDYFKMDWYRLPKILGKPVWTEPYFDKGGGDTVMCTYSTPIYRNVNGKRVFIGVLTMDVSLSGFGRLIKSVTIFKSGYGLLVSRKGVILASPKPSLANRNILDIARENKGRKSQHAVLNMLAGKSGFSPMDGLEAKNAPSYISYAPVSDTGWSFGLIFPHEELFEDMNTVMKALSWIFGVSLVVLLVTTILITRRMTRPIVRLVEATHKIGQGDFNAQLPVRKSRDEVAQLTRAFSIMQNELKTYIEHLEETTAAKEKIESELAVAHAIQMGMLPRGFSTPRNWDLFATVDPAKAVGGDLYDFFYLDADHLCIAIGDVAGKGVPASLFMMVTRTLLRAKAVAGTPIREVMKSINHELCQDNPSEMFVTFFAGIVDLKSGEMEFCNAGHNYPYVLGTGAEVHQLKVRNGIPLGIFEDTVYTSDTFTFRPGEFLVLTTDGITDALNSQNIFFGEANLAAALTTMAHPSTRALTELLIGEVKRFSSGAEQADDITILALQYKGGTGPVSHPPRREEVILPNRVEQLESIAATLERLGDEWGLKPKTVMEMNLVLEELFTNIVFYAFDDDREHVIRIGFELAGDELRITLEDDGKPFNLLERQMGDVLSQPVEERPIGGLGIHFVREIMDRVEYRRDEGRNIVTLAKKIETK